MKETGKLAGSGGISGKPDGTGKRTSGKVLDGKRVLVTRPRNQADELSRLIEERGGEPVVFPMIQTRFPTNPETVRKLDQALASLETFDWVIFTSANGVDFFFARLTELGIDIRSMRKAKLAAVGRKTAQALNGRGLAAEIVPEKFQAEDLLDAMLPGLSAGQKVLLPKADIARDYLPRAMRALGLEVIEVVAYETVAADENADELIELLRNRMIHIATFTSSSTVRNFWSLLNDKGENPAELLRGVEIACIGPKTLETAEELGLTVTRLAKEATVASLVDAIADDE
ncbi:uroporphyrinogen-III synthase [Ferviditalea candida]|uniref:Uroporphyrinogen-III synthase n=1 Tax=Ferviditalea candida TaxID=3108399 RepID=A0ABU5ZER9_9BACL|nr:uroporphyrinogen-III synthase [Paenibacillaceae bacterium T2]